MSYRVYQFDGLALPRFRTIEQEHDMGTGQAESSYIKVPGGYFDLYGSDLSPQGIRPIVAQGYLVEDTPAALLAARDNLRSKIGVRGVLTLQMEDESLRWQYARLLNVGAPSRIAHQRHAFVSLMFESVAQEWNGSTATPSEWIIGDDSFYLGDGTVELGENGTSTALTANGASGIDPPVAGTTQTLTLNNAGNKVARSIVIRVTAGTVLIDAIKITNNTNGKTFYFNYPVNPGQLLVIDSGAMLVTANGVNRYSSLTWDRLNTFFELDPGDNEIEIVVGRNDDADGTISFEYWDTYA